MALLKIVKDGKALVIPHGAYKTMYAPAGWVIEGQESPSEPSKTDEVHDTEGDEEKARQTAETEATKPDDTDERDQSDEPDDTDEDEDYYTLLEETPLSELDSAELRALAEYKGIDVSGITSAKKLREAIQAAR